VSGRKKVEERNEKPFVKKVNDLQAENTPGFNRAPGDLHSHHFLVGSLLSPLVLAGPAKE
jgi:hypothetical protein